VSGQQCNILAAISISKGPDLHIHVYTYRDQFPSIDNPSVGSSGKWKEDGNRHDNMSSIMLHYSARYDRCLVATNQRSRST
jgi:hypothetical protein